MFSRPLAGDGKAVSRPILAVIIVLLVVTSSAAGFFLLQKNSSKTIQKGTAFRADYIGKFEDGRVFDTSLFEVAVNNETYPKSLTYQWTNDSSKFSPVNFTQGSNLIKGFSSGVLGMSVGEWRTFNVTPQEGYSVQASKLKNLSINASVPIDQWMTFAQFNSRYGFSASYQPQKFLFLTDPQWGWNITVNQVNQANSTVMVTNQPESGVQYTAYAGPDSSYGWKVIVSSVVGGEIQIQNLLDSSDARNVKGYDSATKTTYIVSSVDLEGNKAVLYSGKEVDGQALVFTVHVISIS